MNTTSQPITPKKVTATTTAIASVVLIAGGLNAHFEGLRTKAYLDAVGIPTICYGETENVKLGMTKTVDQCEEMMTVRLGWFAMQVDAAVTVEMPVSRHAALTLFAYNAGMGAFRSSTLLKKLNAGDTAGACDQLSLWVNAGGKKLPGLVKRRAVERALCLS